MKVNLKKLLSMGLTITLTAGLSVAGTIAYLTSEDSDVNVMTLGNVKIEQHEYEREVNEGGNYVTDEDGYVLTEFTQAKPLLPAVGTVTGWDETVIPFDQIGGEGNMQMLDGIENAQDKLVVVENTGRTDAYIRTIIAFEAGEKTVDEWNNLVMTSKHNFWSMEVVGIAEIDGNNYVIAEYVYDRVLEAGAVSRNSLSEVYLMPKATNEDCEALDGNNNGTYDILVFSQAVQTAGFADAQTALDTAFGDITTTSHPWTDGVKVESGINMPVVVSDATKLATLLTSDAENISITLAKDIDLPITSLGSQTPGSGEYKLGGENTESIVIDLNGHKLNITTNYWSAIGAKNADATITVKNGSMTSSQATGTWNSYDITFANCDWVIEDVTFDKAVALRSNATLENVTINETHDYYALWITAAGHAVKIDGLTVNSDGRGIKIDEQYEDSASMVTLSVSNAKFTTAKKAAIMVKSVEGAKITLSNVDISGVVADTTNAVWVDEDSVSYIEKVIVNGGSVIVEK